MRILVLGAAAGGGFPQWNCGCGNCRRARAGDPAATPRTQCGVAASVDGERWVLLNASPDLRQQIVSARALDPCGLRHSPIAAVVLTGGEVDAVAGLLALRERQRFSLYATARALDALAANPIFGALSDACVSRQTVPLDAPIDVAGMHLTLFSVPGKVPLYMESPEALRAIGAETEDTVGIELRTAMARALFIPGCAEMSPVLARRLQGADLLLFDGTLWQDDEMIRLGLGDKTGRRMGHMSVAGAAGSLAACAGLDIRRKVYVHLNNSNPLLIEHSPERAAVRTAGWDVAHDGMEIVL